MMLGLALSFVNPILRSKGGGSGGSPGTLDPSIPPPDLVLAVGATTFPPEFDVDLSDPAYAVGDTIVITQYSDARGSSVIATFEHAITLAEAEAEDADVGLSSILSRAYYYDAYIRKPSGDYSNKGARIIHGEAADTTPSAFSFTPVTGAGPSTVYEIEADAPLSGFNQPVAWAISGGEAAFSPDGVTYPAYATSGTAYPGDTPQVKLTSSSSSATVTTATLIVGGVAADATVQTTGINDAWSAAGTDKSQYVTLSGAPALDGLATANQSGTMGAQSTEGPSTTKFHFEVEVLSIGSTASANSRIIVGCCDDTTAFGPAVFPQPGVATPGFSIRLNYNSATVNRYFNGSAFQASATIPGSALPAAGDKIIIEVDTATNAVAVWYYDASAASTASLTTFTLTSQIPTDWRAFAGGYWGGDAWRGNFGLSAFTRAPSSGYAAYGD